MSALLLSVVVPAHQAAKQLPCVLNALAHSDFPRARWELIVVDDGSIDETATVAARWADRVIALPGPARGPAFARNRGVEASAGAWIVFIDADVAVHTDTLARCATIIESEPGVDGMLGAYDDDPPVPGFLSQYRNLLHRYTHLQGEGEAATFWAACGAVRRAAFVAVGGFDEVRYRRPQIEDIELGYRLRDGGSRLVLRGEIQGTHLKRWTFRDAVRSDIWDRGVPWVRLLLERGELSKPATLNVKRGERVKTAAVALALALLLTALLWRRVWPVVLAISLVLVVVLSNLPQFVWFAHRRGARFAALVVPMSVWYYVISGLCVALALGLHILHRGSTREASA